MSYDVTRQEKANGSIYQLNVVIVRILSL